jgi:hypothetical protein
LIRKELDELIFSILEVFNNIGGVIPDVPDGTIGYRIRNVHFIAGVDPDELDIDNVEVNSSFLPG